MIYDIHNPTSTPRIFSDGIAGRQKAIHLKPGQTINGIELGESTVSLLMAQRELMLVEVGLPPPPVIAPEPIPEPEPISLLPEVRIEPVVPKPGPPFNWTISIPVWGDRYVNDFLNVTLPSLKIAAKGISGNLRLIIHTMPADAERMKSALADVGHTICQAPRSGRQYHYDVGIANREAVEMAAMGDVIAFINADMPCSIEVFSASEKRFAQGKRLIVTIGLRTIGGIPPIGAKSADLLRWNWQHRHPWLIETTWPSGKSHTPTCIFFVKGDTVIMHAWHLHPFAMLKDHPIGFKGSTIDTDLGADLPFEDIHVVTDCNELAFAEMSPITRNSGIHNKPNDIISLAKFGAGHTNALHRWYFHHPIVIQGKAEDIGNIEICNKIESQMLSNPPSRPAPPRRR